MPIITLKNKISAPRERVFDLSRSVDLHLESTAQTKEEAVAGKTSGLLNLGDEVTWEAVHFLVRQRLTIRITQFDRPHHFRDTMLSGAFARFDHDHYFETFGNATLMTDVFDFDSPLGFLGRLADRMFLKKHMIDLLEKRNHVIKTIAESGRWKDFVAP